MTPKAPPRNFALGIVLLASSALFLLITNGHYPIGQWLFWTYARQWLVCLVWSVCCLSGGLWVLTKLLPGPLPLSERLLLSLACGVYAFFAGMFLLGMVGGWSRTTAWLLPLALLLLGRREALVAAACLRRAFRRSRRAARSRIAVPVWVFGLLGALMVYLPILLPDNVSHDARWYHLSLAEHYIAAGKIAATPEGWFPSAYPQLATLLYAWCFLVAPHSLFERVELAAHLEWTLFLWTLFGIPLLARRLLLGRRDVDGRAVPTPSLAPSFAALFLFPGIFLYDSSLSTGADHVLAFWAVPLLLAGLRARRLERGPCVLLAILLSGAAMVKYQAGCIVVPVLAALLLRAAYLWRTASAGEIKSRGIEGTLSSGGHATWRVFMEGPLIVVALMGILTAPHWLRNLLFYGDPFYPFLHGFFPSRPFTADTPQRLAQMFAENLWQPHGDLVAKLSETFVALFTFSFIPHDWQNQHGTVPVFGSLFTLLGLTLPFLPGVPRLRGLAGLTFFGLFTWYWGSHQDRYLQSMLPWMATFVAAAIALIWQRGNLARAGIVSLLGAQIVWGGDVYFFPTHIMLGQAPIQSVAHLLSAGFEKNFVQRLRPTYWGFWELGQRLPAHAKVLLHEKRTHLGIDRMTVSDSIGWQGGLSYGLLGSIPAIDDALRNMGVTHVFWETNVTKQYDNLAGELLFLELQTRHLEASEPVEKFVIARMPQERPTQTLPLQVLYKGCGQTYADGIYSLGSMTVPGLSRFPRTSYPAPERPLAKGEPFDLSEVGFVVVDVACKKAEPLPLVQAFELSAVRNRQELWLRKSDRVSLPPAERP